MSTAAPTGQRLSFEDISRLHERQEAIKRANASYLGKHPELKNLIADFTAAILMQKPDDVFKFARDHFSVFLKDSAEDDSTAVYYGKHVISGGRYEVVIVNTKDRAKWLQVTAKNLSTGGATLIAHFSTSEMMARFGLRTADAEQAALQLSRCLEADEAEGALVVTKTVDASPTVEEYDASVKIQAISRSRKQRQQVQEQKKQADAATKIQAQHRRRASSKRVEEIKASNQAATQIQAVYRGKKTRDSKTRTAQQ